MNTRTIETLDSDCKTVNVFKVPPEITLDRTVNKQEDKKFRDLYFVSSYPKKER